MKILGIETSCDETAVALLNDGHVVSSLVYSQIRDHAQYGGVVPELAARKHLEILPALYGKLRRETGLDPASLDAIAATAGPGLAGCLHVGLNFAKGLSFATDVPLYGINHLEGHLASIELAPGAPPAPCIALLVSGGHTSLYVIEAPGMCRQIGATRDDAAGEAFDKCAKVLGLGYPGGPAIDLAARSGDASVFPLPVPRITGSPYDLSFSGLKTALLYKHRDVTHGGEKPLTETGTAHFAASLQQSVVKALLSRCERAAKAFGIPAIVVAGGVAANSCLRAEAEKLTKKGLTFFFPPLSFCTDNAAMIARAAHGRIQRGEKPDGLAISARSRWPVADTLPAGSEIPARKKPRTGR
ncbi:MAG: tRNA (adenosine(37)-N6)-threonylcarbamoyltransferase complex transferase subunit TsaD [Deltaproteobacteria bacterium]|nr:tRNA (adenosine(37)-N6)-threonylcarbamoyltransferase complex transferase subunit TsaD [Deltaproteobacteria bacterium]